MHPTPTGQVDVTTKVDVCPHQFGDNGMERPHYCTYIQVTLLLSCFPSFLITTDDLQLYSFCSSSVLWLNLQWADLRALQRQSWKVLSLANCRSAIKRLRRANACAAVALHQTDLTYNNLSRRGTSLSFQIATVDRSLPLLQDVSSALVALANEEVTHDAGVIEDEGLLASQRAEMESLQAQLARKHRLFSVGVDELFRMLAATSTAPELPMRRLVDADRLREPAAVTLKRHHPQALNEISSSHDELTFITAHQTFELWFPCVLVWVDEVIEHLSVAHTRLDLAQVAVQKISAIYRLFGEMIQIPQTMTAADYLAFRRQLEGGSGLESIGFRLLEVSIGQRDEKSVQSLTRMNLITIEIAARLARPSISDAYLEQLRHVGVIEAVDDLAEAASRIAGVMRPVGVDGAHAELLSLGESLVELEQAMEAWKHHHLSMVDRMTGYRSSLGVGGHAPAKLVQPGCPMGHDLVDGKSYLLQTLRYRRVFSYLWEARSRIPDTYSLAAGVR